MYKTAFRSEDLGPTLTNCHCLSGDESDLVDHRSRFICLAGGVSHSAEKVRPAAHVQRMNTLRKEETINGLRSRGTYALDDNLVEASFFETKSGIKDSLSCNAFLRLRCLSEIPVPNAIEFNEFLSGPSQQID